ncbi:hypothetical protein K8R62_02340, partial [bacterium]|nr:hypothetical protein [bacterium]
LGEMIENWPKLRPRDVKLLKVGRVYWFNLERKGKALVIVGRNEEENNILEKIRQKNDFVLKLKDINGPTTLVRFFDFYLNGDSIKGIKDGKIDVKIPKNLEKDDLSPEKEKTLSEILGISRLLTGWHCTKARGRKVSLELEIK